jgi:hypothetical protein
LRRLVRRILNSYGFEAEFYKDSKTDLYHFVISRQGDAEIVMWGQEVSYDEAQRVALDWMKAFGNRASHAG